LEKYIYKYEPLWGKWYFNELLGAGNDGEVFKISREEWGYKQLAAVKVISIDDKNADKSINKIVNKIQKLYKLSNDSNILTYQDYLVCKKEMYHILVKTEYLPPLSKIVQKKQFDENDSIKLGIDICQALEKYHNEDIIHGNIKESNIFIDNEKFKLGDFYMLKELPNEIPISKMKESRFYAAPEIISGNKYDKSIDFYSLGIILYKLFNNGLIPFLSNKMSNQEVEEAFNNRLMVKEIPPPLYGSSSIKEIILKACSFYPENRYSNAVDFKNDLLKLYNKEDKANIKTNLDNFKKQDGYINSNVNNADFEANKIIFNKSSLDSDENISNSKKYIDIQSLDINENMDDVTIIGNLDLSKYKNIIEEEENKKITNNELSKNNKNTVTYAPLKMDDGSVELTQDIKDIHKTNLNSNTNTNKNSNMNTKQNDYLSNNFNTNKEDRKKESNETNKYLDEMGKNNRSRKKALIITVAFVLFVGIGIFIKIISN
jgi:serine/threonine protein kinase